MYAFMYTDSKSDFKLCNEESDKSCTNGDFNRSYEKEGTEESSLEFISADSVKDVLQGVEAKEEGISALYISL